MDASAKVADIIATVERLAGHPLHPDEGVQVGDPEHHVKNALVCWMATHEALLVAERLGAELVICHESLFYPYDVRLKTGERQEWENWRTNRQRRSVIERARMTALRIHFSADELCIFDTFASLLGLGAPVEGSGWHKIFEISPVPLKDLTQRVKDAIGMAHVRLSCPKLSWDRPVRRVGLPWGGLGLFVNVSYQEWALEHGCDVLIAGESDSYGFRFSGECGVPMIETSHEASEIPGLRQFAAALSEHHPEVQFRFYEEDPAWEWR